jgi:hypothetical protein
MTMNKLHVRARLTHAWTDGRSRALLGDIEVLVNTSDLDNGTFRMPSLSDDNIYAASTDENDKYSLTLTNVANNCTDAPRDKINCGVKSRQ